MEQRRAAVILAGGSGERINSVRPKQFLKIGDKPIVAHTIERFDKNSLITDITIVCREEYVKDMEELIDRNAFKKIYKVIKGGKTRQESSFTGIKNVPENTEFVLIHDAVRPFIGNELIEAVLTAAKEVSAAGPVIDMDDTLIVQKDGFIKDIPDRANLKRIQTPQGFVHETILKAHEWAVKNGICGYTDDCGLVLAMGGSVKAVEGSAFNIKITNQTDLVLAERLMHFKNAGFRI